MGKKVKKALILFLPLLMYGALFPLPSYAVLPSSSHYELDGYSFGGGGTSNNTSSSSYGLYGISGEVEFGNPSSSSYKANSGLTYLITSNVPGTPTISNPGSTYDRLKIVLNTSSNPTDTTYAIQLSTASNFTSGILYAKQDNTTGPTLTASDYKTYSGTGTAGWGGSSGTFLTGLQPNTTYYFRVKARQGAYSESGYGPSSSGTTSTAALSFTLSNSSIAFSNLNAGDSYTDSAQSTTLTTTTNAYNGYTVYAKETQSLTTPDGSTIADYASPNSSPTTWSGTGFGYNTNDTNLTGGTANRFSGSKYAGFTITNSSPGDPVADDPGPVQSAEISNEAFVISYRVTGNNVTPAGTYSNAILYTIVPEY